MKVNIICIGSLKERYWTEAVEEYSKRLSRYCILSINELREERLQDNPSEAQEMNVRDIEGKNILKQIRKDSYVIALEIQGKEFSSERLAEKVSSLAVDGKSEICFIIGGSIGLSQEVLSRADLKLSFSKMTFPHQMMRVILLEQIYRSFKIIRNEKYHK